MSLTTLAEQRADATRQLRGFRDFSLLGVRDKVTEMLGHIGRDHVFATYTKHDISHVDHMLGMLEWIVPETTLEAMTPADWLMVVLAIYFHDLGMLVTQEEFEQRNEKSDFPQWFEALDTTTEGKEYLARTYRMNAAEKEIFFFQEYVRLGHARRIWEWITGRRSQQWSEGVAVAARIVGDMMKTLPSRFVEHLATVCRSHHDSNLDNGELFPLYAPCGGSMEATVNVQYAAILLRTVDLLHITHDRAPSVSFQLIQLTDPKGVSEWDKQRGTFSVMPAQRDLDDDPDSAWVVVHADFSEEQPLFALQEYISYATDQINLSRRWAAKSLEHSNAAKYHFPWQGVRGDVRIEGVKPVPLKFELDRGRLLDLLVGHTIYNDATVALRELLQNGIDAVRFHEFKRRQRPQGVEVDEGRVRVKWNPATRRLVVEDNGTGMDRDIIQNHLMMVGASYYSTEQFKNEFADFSPISRFGIGVLTCFMISDDIEILTVRGGRGHRVRMTSVKSNYLLRELDPHDRLLEGLGEHGTRVSLRLRDTINLETRSVRDIVHYWIVLPECRVEFQEVGEFEDESELEAVGFSSVRAALESFYAAEVRKRLDRKGWQDSQLQFVVRSNSPGDGSVVPTGGQIEFGFAISKALGRGQVTESPEEGLPLVCIEGIRASGEIPWFGEELGAIVSVRGNRELRTTVSRADLEKDSEYERLGKSVADFLIEQIIEVVGEISQGGQGPLSQASSTARWQTDDLENRAESKRAWEYLRQAKARIPTLVVESLKERTGGDRVSQRKLINAEELKRLGSFWVIESRLVDSLGLVSRDLGRELSLNEFLLTLAPERTDLKLSPLLADAHLFGALIRENHEITLAKISTSDRQTALNFSRRSSGPSLHEAFPQHLLEVLPDLIRSEADILGDVGVYSPLDGSHVPLVDFPERLKPEDTEDLLARALAFPIVDFEVADPQIQILDSRLGRAFRAGSRFGDLYGAIRSALVSLMQESILSNSRSVASLLVCLAFLTTKILRRRSVQRSLSTRDGRAWGRNVDEVRRVLAVRAPGLELPPDLDWFDHDRMVFDASRYWINWFA